MKRKRTLRTERQRSKRQTGFSNHVAARRVTLAAVLFLLSIAVFWPSRMAAFVWDDLPYNLAGNPALMRGDYAEFWRQPYRDFYIPITYSAWTLIAHTTGSANGEDAPLDPESFHTVNVFVHAANTVLVFWLLSVLTESVGAAGLGAALFAVHPLQVESVVWVSELRGLLAAFFSLAALLLHCRYRQGHSARTVLAMLSAGCFLVAILCKPSATTFPVAIAVADLFVYRDRLSKYWWVIPTVWTGLAAPAMVIAKRLQPNVTVEFIPRVWQRMRVAADALTFYLGKLVLPWPLSPSYGRTPAVALAWHFRNVLWVLPVALGVFAWRLRRVLPLVPLGLTIVLAGLVPVLGLVPFKGQNFSTVADRYMYVPLAGVALIVSSLAMRLTMNRTRWLIAVAVIALLTVVNVQYQSVWHDELTLWRHAAVKYPGQPRVHNNYGAALQVAGSQNEAIVQFDLALKARPDFSDAYCNRGNSLGQLHRYAEALADQTRAVELDPSDGGCWYDRAVTLFAMGRFDESFRDVTQAQQRGYQPPPSFLNAVRARLNAAGR